MPMHIKFQKMLVSYIRPCHQTVLSHHPRDRHPLYHVLLENRASSSALLPLSHVRLISRYSLRATNIKH